MKRIFSFLLVIFLNTATFTYSDTIINDIENFSKLFPRNEASVNENITLELIEKRLSDAGVEFTRTGFEESEGYHSFSSYIETDIAGAINDSLITVVPVDGSYGIAAALSVIKYYSVHRPQLSLKFVFLGAEQYADNNPGTRIFLERYYPENPAAFLYLNFDGLPSSVRIVAGADGYSSPYYLFSSTALSLQAAGIPWTHSNTESILFRLKSAGTESRIKDYLEQGYPAIELTDANSAVITDPDMVDGDRWVGFYTKLLGDFQEGLPADWDSHYIFGISEQVYLLIYVVILMLLMIYPIFRRKHFGWYMKTLLTNFWSLLLLYCFVYAFLSLTSLIISSLLGYLGFESKWKYIPVIIFLFKLTAAMFFYSIALKLISKLPFSRRGSFYSISAIFFLVIVLLILTAINLSISFFALWSLCFIFLFTVFRKPAVKLLMLVISALWIFFGLYEIFTLPSLNVIRILTLSPVKGDLLVAAGLLPFILAGIRLDLLSPVSGKFTRFLPLILGVAAATLLVLTIFLSPFSSENPQPVYITDDYNQDNGKRNLGMNSPLRMSEELEREAAAAVPLSTDIRDNISITVDTRPFLNRKIIDTTIEFLLPPSLIRISMDSAEPLILYESSLPAEWLPTERKLEIYVGRNPVLPLSFSLTLNRTAAVNFTVEAVYDEEPIPFKMDENSYMLMHSLVVKKRYSEDG